VPWAAFVAMFVVMGLTLLPWTIRQYRSSGHFILVSTGTSDAFSSRLHLQPESVHHRTETAIHGRGKTRATPTSAPFPVPLARHGKKSDYQTDQILNR